CPAHVRLALAGLVRERLRSPRRRGLRIAIDAELSPPAFDDPEEAVVVEVAGGHELAEAVGRLRRPLAMHVDDDPALGGLEPDAIVLRRGPHSGDDESRARQKKGTHAPILGARGRDTTPSAPASSS